MSPMPGDNDTQTQTSTIAQALQASLDPRVNHDTRQQALQYLEGVKSQPNAPHHGFTLANDPHQATTVRYFGLQLLEFAIKYQWITYDAGHIEQLQRWIVILADATIESDATFFRNKIGQIWVECAKRCWGESWTDMDEQLWRLWDKSTQNGVASEKVSAHRLLVLFIIETLSEDICNREDATAGLRLDLLGSTLNAIIVPESVYEQIYEAKEVRRFRHGQRGWFEALCWHIVHCTQHFNNRERGFSNKPAMLQGLTALKALVLWIGLKAVVALPICLQGLFDALRLPDVNTRTATVETLFALLARPPVVHFKLEEREILQQVMFLESLPSLAAVYQNERFMPSEHDEIYLLQRKTGELVAAIVDAILAHPPVEYSQSSMDTVFELLSEILQNQSLVVSIPVLHSWSKLMDSRESAIASRCSQALSMLVELCSQRLVNYEMLPEDTDLTTLRFLNQDFESMPERHAFLGNYRRYCVKTLEAISRQEPYEAIMHVFGQLETMLKTGPYTVQNGFDPQTYSKTSLVVLQFDAHFTVATSVLKGWSAWRAVSYHTQQDEPDFAQVDAIRFKTSQALHEWCVAVIQRPIDDPEVTCHILTLLTGVFRVTKPDATLTLAITRWLLAINLRHLPTATAYTESKKGFEAFRVLELQKLALLYTKPLFEHYEEMASKVDEILKLNGHDDRVVSGSRAFLFLIVQREPSLEDHAKLQRLQQILEPVLSAWQDPALQQATETLGAFCGTLGVDNLPAFYAQHGFDTTEDWAQRELDAQGQARQATIRRRMDQLPLRITKAMLSATTERLQDDSKEYALACELWGASLPVVLHSLLNMVRHAQAFNNPSQWSSLPPRMQAVMQRTLQDRFWQSGISNESRDQFYARISGSKTSYEGFGSSVRGTMRNVREQGYHIIYLLARFEEQFYGLSELPEPLASALFDDAEYLSTHHLQAVINLATGLVQRCPPQYRASFLPPLLTRMFAKLDKKISGEWQAVIRITEQSTEDDDLSEEMRIESVLRQLTFSMVAFVTYILSDEKHKINGQPSARPYVNEVVLADLSILEPLLMFCTHALRMRDTRSCVAICKILMTVMPAFLSDQPTAAQVREFISTEVLQASITSLNEPYFADMQKDLASLIAELLIQYTPKTATPRTVLLSLPDMQAAKVDKTIESLRKNRSARSQRAYVLNLLEGVRGVSIHESGKLVQPAAKKLIVQAQYMEVEQKPAIVHGDDAPLDAISGLFGDA